MAASSIEPDVGDVIARADDYASLIAGLIARRHELGLSQRAVDDIAGVADGYAAKIECGLKTAGKVSLTCLMKTLGVEIVLVRTAPHPLVKLHSRDVPASAFIGKAPREKAA